MSALELLPERSTYSPGDPIAIEVRGSAGTGTGTGAGNGTIVVRHLGDEVSRAIHTGGSKLLLDALPVGGYGVELIVDGVVIRTAIEVRTDSRARLRYGFVVDYSPDRDLTGVSDLVRRLHLTDIQFYDWAYRHADLLGGGEEYRDALDQPISLQTVRDLASAVRSAGARALGYAAVYAVGPNEWTDWRHRAILDATGEPYALGDFLFLLDPAAPDWLASFTGQLRRAVTEVGFDGFHLDQYGYPKRALRADGKSIDIAESFTTVIEASRVALPGSQLVFNNVNDFPTWATAGTRQDAVYIEVWEPNVTLGSLGVVVLRARSVANGKPIVVAAYQHVYDSASANESDLATAFTMATLFSHGATQLLAGEADRILVDPYYVRNHVVEASTAALLTRWYGFLVEHDELLMDAGIVDVTGSYAGEHNDDCDVAYESVAVSVTAEPGTVWRRITSAGDRLILHLINLGGQQNALWDAARNEPVRPGTGSLRLRRVGNGIPRVRVADPDAAGYLIDVEVVLEGTHATATLPDFAVWQLILIELEGETE
jgi:dextranase